MTVRRRDFLKLAGASALSGVLPRMARGADNAGVYDIERFGNARILHITDTHAQLLPVYFREPSINLGLGAMQGQPPHLVGRAFLDRFAIRPDSADAYAFTCVDFEKSAPRFGKLGGFAHLKTLIDRLRSDAGSGRSLLLDGGDLWQGTGLANTMQGTDMVEAANLLGIEAMTGHWEFTYGENALRDNHSGSRLQRRQGIRCRVGTRLQAGHDQGTRRPSGGRDRTGLSLCADRASEAVHAGLDVRDPRRRIAKAGQYAANQRQGRCGGAAVA
jgi:hypothetical protein